MTLDDLFLNINTAGFDSLVNQADVKTAEDKRKYQGQGYLIELTKEEFEARFSDLDPHLIWYSPSISNGCFYFNKETLAVCPFHIEFFVHGMTSASIETVGAAFAQAEEKAASGEYLESLLVLTDVMRSEYFTLLVEKKGSEVPKLYNLFFSCYLFSDYGFSKVDPATFQTILQSKRPADKAKTTKQLKAFPDTITIYRGGNSASAPYQQAYSWTLDINTANFFAVRRGTGPAYIVKGEVKKRDVIECLFEDGDEQEVVMDPQKVTIQEVINLKGMDFLEEYIPKVKRMYQEYRDKMDSLDFYQESSIHGKEHEARVLLLCLIMAEMLELPSSDREILATAAIYHDTQRTHDGVEPDHGRASSEYYYEDTPNPDPIVDFLCEYHCQADEEGYAEIRRNRRLSKNRKRVECLFQIFKDADGLDRVRLGNIKQEMDLNQYRLPITKELTLVARICLDNVKI